MGQRIFRRLARQKSTTVSNFAGCSWTRAERKEPLVWAALEGSQGRTLSGKCQPQEITRGVIPRTEYHQDAKIKETGRKVSGHRELGMMSGEGDRCDHKGAARGTAWGSMRVDCGGRYVTIHTWKQGTELDTHTAPTSASWFRYCADGWGRLVQGTLCATPATAWGGLHPWPLADCRAPWDGLHPRPLAECRAWHGSARMGTLLNSHSDPVKLHLYGPHFSPGN